jgi:hypothetical protein
LNLDLKNYEVLNTIELLKQLMQFEFDMDVAWDMKRNMKKLESIYKIYCELNSELIQKYAIKDENLKVKLDENGSPKFPPANKEKYTKEINTLLNCKNEIDLKQIKYSNLKEHISKIKPSILFDLDFLIEDDSE